MSRVQRYPPPSIESASVVSWITEKVASCLLAHASIRHTRKNLASHRCSFDMRLANTTRGSIFLFDAAELVPVIEAQLYRSASRVIDSEGRVVLRGQWTGISVIAACTPRERASSVDWVELGRPLRGSTRSRLLKSMIHKQPRYPTYSGRSFSRVHPDSTGVKYCPHRSPSTTPSRRVPPADTLEYRKALLRVRNVIPRPINNGYTHAPPVATGCGCGWLAGCRRVCVCVCRPRKH